MLESDSAQLGHKFSRDVIDVWRHLKQRHTTVTCEGIRVSVPISSKCADIEWYLHACYSAFIAHFQSFNIYSYVINYFSYLPQDSM